MASPIGHACVGVAVAALAANVTDTPSSTALWLGAVVASGLPDLDLLTEIIGRKGPRYHRNASHSLFVLAFLSAGIFAVGRWVGVDPGVAVAWTVALLSHPFLDLVTTGPETAEQGYGIALLWPIAKRRFYVPRPIVVSPNLEGCRSVADVWREVRVEVLTIVPLAVCVIVVAVML